MDTYFSTFPGYYDTMDAGVKDEHGYIKVSIGSNTIGYFKASIDNTIGNLKFKHKLF